MRRRWTFGLALVAVPLAIAGRAQPVSGQGLADILARVGASVERYYARAQSVMCTETVSLQTLGYDLTADMSMQRRLVYELRVAWDPRDDGGVP